jgi:GTPase SAR1 family protein
LERNHLDAIFITGTAGSGKSALTSRLIQWYKDNSAYPVSLNLDPGSLKLPYEPDVDVRDYIEVNTLMEKYDLGPNGSLVMASDLIATRLDEIQTEVNELNPDYVIIDTPGQIELFAFRASGPYFVTNFQADNKASVFAFDGMLVSSPVNYISISLLSSAVKLRLKMAQVNALTKRDLLLDRLQGILEWSTSMTSLEKSLDSEKDSEYSLLCKEIARSYSLGGFAEDLFAISNLTMSGMVNLVAALARILNQGEEVRD